jgi:SAM-dependent methyltransferase
VVVNVLVKRRRSTKRKAQSQRERRDDAEGLRALERLENERTLFEPALTRVVRAALERAGLAGGDSPVIEIGSGGGQLRRWLPAPLLPVMVHTEREPAFVRKLQRAVPRATVQVASAEALPYADGSVAGVLGLCVLDVVDLEAVARELHRVLRPGGSAVQFWDMAPSMRWLCEREMRSGRVLLPDCFSDPLVRAELPDELQAVLPPLDFLRDLVSVPSGQLHSLIALLRPSPSNLIDAPSLERLARYAQLFDQPSEDGWPAASTEAARALRWLCEDEQQAHACKRLLLNAWLILQQARGGSKLPLELRELSSAQALSERLAEVFGARGMAVECDVRRARALVPRPDGADGRLSRARFVGRWLGTTAYAAEVPPADPDVLAASDLVAPDHLVVEAGVLVLIARQRRSVSRPDPRIAPAVEAVQRALDWYIAKVADAEPRPITRADAEGLRELLAGRRGREERDFGLLFAFAWKERKIATLGGVPTCNLGDVLSALAHVDSGEAPFAYDTAVDPGAFAKLSFRETSLGIGKAQRDHKEGWWAHAQRNRSFINEAASRTTGRELAVVLGAGQAFDLPLVELAQRFEKLVLIDIDGQALEQTVQEVFPDPGVRSRLELRVLDLTGINRALVERLEALVAGPGSAGEVREQVARLCQGYRLVPPPRLLPEDERADLLVSSCVLTQLAWPQRTFAERLYQKRFGSLPDPVEQRWAGPWAQLELRVQQDHFTALAGVAEVVALTTDVVSHVTALDASGAERPTGETVPALGVPKLEERIPQFFRVEAHQSWEWPRYKATALGQGSLMSVEGVVLRAR